MGKVYDSFNYPEVTAETAKTMGLADWEFENAVKILGRTPNYIELGCISAMWSEHCSYKSSKIHLRKLPTKGEAVVFGPGENAGVARVDGDICICFKIESHNHPSFIEPFHGAATGVGGILRDVFTMGAIPVAGMNSLRFGNFDYSRTSELVKESVRGIAHYGNEFGTPTVGGEIVFHPSYAKNPLVNAFILGVVREDKIFTAKATGVGNPVIYIGAKTGMDGIHGANMASEEFSATGTSRKPRIPIGDPVKEKRLFNACMELMQTDALVGIQDMGAAGLASSSFEMAGRAESGVKMYLDRVPTQEAGMTPYELMLSESQERMLLVAKKGREQEIIDTVNKWELDAAIIGEVTGDGFVTLYWNGEEVAKVEAAPLSDNAPAYDRPYARGAWMDEIEKLDSAAIAIPKDLNATFLRLLESPTVASKRWVYDQFTPMKEFGAITNIGSDAAVIRLEGTKKGVALSTDCIGRYCQLNSRLGAAHAVAESARNVAAAGARPLALTNCLNYGNPEKPDVMYQLVEGIEGIAEAARALSTPVVSGNVSLYNETEGQPILPTPIITMTGVLDNADDYLESHFKAAGNRVFLVGKLPDRIDASHYLEIIHDRINGKVADVDLAFHVKLIDFMVEAAQKHLISAAHDTSDGGLAVALFEMGHKNAIGADIKLSASARADALLFGETPMMLLEVSPANTDAVSALLKKHGLSFADAGSTGGSAVTISTDTQNLLNTDMAKASAIYENTLPKLVK